ncbi:hypothetical protein PFISCL1PPCAC_23810, partial [Pristionchus fissidentatus]
DHVTVEVGQTSKPVEQHDTRHFRLLNALFNQSEVGSLCRLVEDLVVLCESSVTLETKFLEDDFDFLLDGSELWNCFDFVIRRIFGNGIFEFAKGRLRNNKNIVAVHLEN